ncbi:putative ester cyclase [Actinoalloteichus hoggarensis]|uniref:SnoaL-like domain protein n=1 Tax=Actinoalloteichus hoggarensis TaxID=1470176 RepID=A0A221VYU6_9PSEU|nr:nuclear transport factor 2 family protein [Actinoalloteichus hoggarensis]ASO18654.1 SnoaL-like domain protein [Actinoalloteichus hoggarensis]MBB5919885.1 putative ester cyclase [Actinoalloteichus hoggarensis]
MTQRHTRGELVARLVRAGEIMVSGEGTAEVDSYFDIENFVFDGPDGFDTDYAGLMDYFRSLRSALDDRSIRRGIVLAEGDLIACQTWIEGTFVRPFTQSPVGRLEPTGTRVVMDLINIFRFDDQGRLVEEFVRFDNRSFLRQLGAQGA